MMKGSNTPPPRSNGKLKVKTKPTDLVPSTTRTSSPTKTPTPKAPSSKSSLTNQKSKIKKTKKQKSSKKGFRIKSECILWFVVLMMGGMLIVVNYMLLQIQDNEDSMVKIDESFRQKDSKQQLDGLQESLPIDHHHHHHSMLSPEKDPTPRKEKTTEELGPILDILKQAQIEDTPELRKQLPTWDQVVHRYGPKPIIYGLETCEEFKNIVPNWRDRFIAPAGPFNSGTNLLYTLLLENCRIAGRKDRTQWQVNWGKHQPPRYRYKNHINPNINNTNVLPLVMVRDPWTWMHSMCKTRYAAKWLHAPEHCPNLIPNEVEGFYHNKKRAFLTEHFNNYTKNAQERMLLWKAVLDRAIYHHGEDKTIPVKIVYKNGVDHHKSLAHFWKEWYQEYWDSTFPRLFIRLEDLVFYPRQVIKTTCECVGGKFIGQGSKLKLQDESAKEGQRAHGNNLNNLAKAMANHVFFNRTKGMTHDDIQYAKEILDDSIFNDFGYHPPIEPIEKKRYVKVY